MIVGVPALVEPAHGCLEYPPGHGLAGHGAAYDHGAVTRVLGLVQLQYFSDGVLDVLQASGLQLGSNCLQELLKQSMKTCMRPTKINPVFLGLIHVLLPFLWK